MEHPHQTVMIYVWVKFSRDWLIPNYISVTASSLHIRLHDQTLFCSWIPILKLGFMGLHQRWFDYLSRSLRFSTASKELVHNHCLLVSINKACIITKWNPDDLFVRLEREVVSAFVLLIILSHKFHIWLCLQLRYAGSIWFILLWIFAHDENDHWCPLFFSLHIFHIRALEDHFV